MTSEADKKQQSNNTESESGAGSAIALWMPIGAGLGVALGVAFDNFALGIGIGVALGSVIGAAIEQRHKGIEVATRAKQRPRLLLVTGLGILVFLMIMVIAFGLPFIL